MKTLELAPLQRNTSWFMAAVLGISLFVCAFSVREKFFFPADGDFFSYIDVLLLLISSFAAIAFGSLKSSVEVYVSEPPVLIRRKIWFGKLETINRTVLKDIVWVRAIYVDDGLISIEGGTYGHQTTSLFCISYSKNNIHVAEQLCAKVAAALRLENKGYYRYMLFES